MVTNTTSFIPPVDLRTKQALVLRTDLKARKGKWVVQGSHATWGSFMDKATLNETHGHQLVLTIPVTPAEAAWLLGNHRKICLGVPSEAALLELYERAKAAGIPCTLIQDNGLTEFEGPTYTAVSIGPAEESDVDAFTAGLSLFQ